MATTNFKGITIQLDIDSDDFESKLKKCNRAIDDFDRQLKKINDALKIDPKAYDLLATKTDLLKQKQNQLNNNIAQFQQALNGLKAKGIEETDKRVIDLRTSLAKAKKELENIQQELWKVSVYKITQPIEAFQKATEKAGKALTEVGKQLAPLSLFASGILTKSTKSAIDFESAFASVRKTVDTGTDSVAESEKVFDSLRQQIIETSRVLPITASDFAELVSLAGQYAIPADQVIEFSKAMVDLDQATDLTAEDSAKLLAQFFNVTRTGVDKIRNFASALVWAGNNTKSTESEILEMSFRLAGAGSQLGFTQAQILALSAALSSAGLNAEAAGGSISSVMQNMQKVVSGVADNSASKLETFGKLLGMSGEEFKKAWNADTFNTFAEVINALGKLSEGNTDMITLFDEMGIKSIRQTDSMSRLVQAYQTLEPYVENINREYDLGVALEKEAIERYKTFASQIQVLKNNLQALGITIGNAVLPYLQRFNDWFYENFDAIKAFVENNADMIVKVLAVVGALSPVLIIGGKIMTMISGVSGALKKLIESKFAMKIANMFKQAFSAKIPLFQVGEPATGLLGKLATIGKAVVDAFTPIRAIILLVVGALVYAYNAVDSFRERVNNFVKTMIGQFKPIIEGVIAILSTLGGIIKEIVQPVIVALKDIFKNHIVPLLTTIAGLVMDIIAVVTTLVSSIWQFLYPIIGLIAEFLKMIFIPIWDAVISIVRDVIEAILDLINMLIGLWDEFKKTDLVQGMIDIFDKLGEDLQGMKNIFDKFKGWVSGAIDKLKEFLGLNEEAKGVNVAQFAKPSASIRNGMYQIPYTATQSGGFASGGITSNVTINVNNNGKSITASEVRRWASIINDELGGSF